MKIELVNDSANLKDDVLKEVYDLVVANTMRFKSCLSIEGGLVFILKDPNGLFTAKKDDNAYNFKLESEDLNFEYLVHEDKVEIILEKFRKRQVFG